MEQIVVLQCLREVRQRIGMRTALAAAKKLVELDSENIQIGVATDCLHGKAINGDASLNIAKAALKILVDNYDVVMQHYAGSNGTLTYVTSTIRKHAELSENGPTGAAASDGYASVISANWNASLRKGNGVLKTGIYQLFRRFKSETPDTGDSHKPDRRGQVVICEVVHVDSDRMECTMITSERHVYFGSLFVNHEDIIFGIFQRKTLSGGINQRFIALKLEGQWLPMYSGLCIKVGATTRLPVASDCIYVKVRAPHYERLLKEFEQIKRSGWKGEFIPPVDRRSALAQYITENPPAVPYSSTHPAWSRVKFIEQFPALAKWSTPDKAGHVFFGEPLRTTSGETLVRLGRDQTLPVFKQNSSRAGPRHRSRQKGGGSSVAEE
jgi:hypothetical protein